MKCPRNLNLKRFKVPNFFRVNFLLILAISINLSVVKGQIIGTLGTTLTADAPDIFGYNGQNVLHNIQWGTVGLTNNISKLDASMLRYPAGTISNWWNWQIGGFFTDPQLPSFAIYGSHYGASPVDDNLFYFKYTDGAASAMPMYVLNLLTSNSNYQMSMLWHIKNYLLPLRDIELGNEFYLEDATYISAPNTKSASTYAGVCNVWADSIRQMFGTSVKIAAVGAYNATNELSPRRVNWNSQLLTSLHTPDNPSSSGTYVDAITIHYYIGPGSGIASVGTDIENNQFGVITANALAAVSPLQSEIATALRPANPNLKVWISEYNVEDQGVAFNGSWAHGIYMAALTLEYLGVTFKKPIGFGASHYPITRILCHDMADDASTGGMFDKSHTGATTSTSFYSTYQGPTPLTYNTQSHTNTHLSQNLIGNDNQFETTAEGATLSLLGKAMKNVASYTQISFPTGDSLLGYDFVSVDGYEQEVVLNLSIHAQSISIPIFSNAGIDSCEELMDAFYEDYPTHSTNILTFVNGNPVNAPGNVLPVTTNITTNGVLRINPSVPFGGPFTMEPYSIARFYVGNPLRVFASTTKLCYATGTTPDSVVLTASGGVPPYTWTGMYLIKNNTTDHSSKIAQPTSTTTYTATDANMTSQSITVTVNTVSPITVAQSPTGTICPGSSVTLTASGGANSSQYFWEPGNYLSKYLGNGLTATPLKTTTYTVHYFDQATGCFSPTAQITVNVIPKPIAGPDRLLCYNLSGDTVKLGSKGNSSSYFYSWSPTTGISGSTTDTDAVAILTLNSKTSYILTEISTSPSCTVRDTVVVTVKAHCCLSSDSGSFYNVLNTPYSKFYNQLTSSRKGILPNGDGTNNYYIYAHAHPIYVNGVLSLDSGASIHNCIFYMAPGASIAITKNYRNDVLMADKFYACPTNDTMWNGIQDTLASSNLTVEDSAGKPTTITDAIIGLEGAYNGDVTAINDTFARNEFDMYLHDYYEPTYSGSIYGNTFDQSGPYVLYPWYFTSLTFGYTVTGIQLTNCTPYINATLQIGNNAQGSNNFIAGGIFWFAYGLHATNSLVSCYKNTFQYFVENAIVADTLQNPTLTDTFNIKVGDGTTASSNTILGGVFQSSGYHRINVMKNTFTGITSGGGVGGILVQNGAGSGGQIQISKNTVTSPEGGIKSYYNDNSVVKILNNTVSTTLGSGIGAQTIDVEDFASAAKRTLTGNSLTLTNSSGALVSYGIYCSELGYLQIGNTGTAANTINLNGSTGGNYGIRLDNCNGAELINNSVLGDNSTNMPNKTGISINMSASDTLECNTLDYTGTGLEAIYDCYPLKPYGNTFNHHTQTFLAGATYTTTTQIGEQPPTSYPNTDGNIFNVHGNGTSSWDLYSIHLSVATNYHKQSTPPGTDPTTVGRFSGDPAGFNLLPDKIGYYACFNSIPNVILKKTNNSESQTDAFKELSNQQQDSTNIDTLTHWLDLKNSYESLLRNDSLLNSSDSLRAFFNSLQGTNINHFSIIDTLLQTIGDSLETEDEVASNFATANQINNSISSSLIFEINLKSVNKIYLSTIGEGINKLSASEINQIASIADQCPYTGGPAVFKARSLLKVLERDTTHYNDSLLCSANLDLNKKRATEKLIASAEFVSVFPNPAVNSLNILYELNQPNEMITINDILGKIFLKESLQNGTGEIRLDLTSLPAGIYYLKVGDLVRKFSIIR